MTFYLTKWYKEFELEKFIQILFYYHYEMRRHTMVIVHIEILKSNQCQTTLTASHLG